MYSSADMLALVAELNATRIAQVAGKRSKRLGGMHMLSDKSVALLKTARRMHHRYMAGKYEHNEQEKGRLCELCQLLLQWHADNEGTQPKPWTPPLSLESKRPCPAGTYERVLQMAADGWKGGFAVRPA